MVLPANETQRRAPLTSTPSFSVSHSSTMETTSTPSAASRACRWLRNDVPSSTGSAKRSNIACRMMKCHGLRPSRSATGGLAAKLSSMPTAINRIRADSNCLSIVHHHSAIGVLRSRANIYCAALARRPPTRNTPAHSSAGLVSKV